jgi:hypothetical protein
MSEPFLDFYRCPEDFGTFDLAGPLRTAPGYFRFGHDAICYGQTSSGYCSSSPNDGLFDSFHSVSFQHTGVRLPFQLSQIVDNLRSERYLPPPNGGIAHEIVRDWYYTIRPLLGIPVRKHLQKWFLRGWERISFPHWPVDDTVEVLFERLMALALKSHDVDAIPFIWFWPEGASNCIMMTHDVETKAGAGFCSPLMDIDDAWGIKASFQIVPEVRYRVSPQLLDSIRQRGFELNVQDLNHDGCLFNDRREFLVRATAINRHLKRFGSRGFRSAVMYRNPDWLEALDISYDMSIPNTAHLEPQRGGCCTVFPYFIGQILEIPLTTVQDYSLFHILNEYSIELWKRQISLIQQRHGLASFIIHPDYIIAGKARDTYLALLEYLRQLRKRENIWTALPCEVDQWWRARAQMHLVMNQGRWIVEGPGSERACVAFATLQGERVNYTVSNEGRPAFAYAS